MVGKESKSGPVSTFLVEFPIAVRDDGVMDGHAEAWVEDFYTKEFVTGGKFAIFRASPQSPSRGVFMLWRCCRVLLCLQVAAVAVQCFGQAPGSPVNATSAQAAPSIPRQDMVITVSSEAIPLSASASSVTVIGQEQIRESAAQNVGDILRQVPFLHMQRAGGEGALTTVYMRGTKENLVMVMIDGIQINDLTNTLGGSFDFSTLTTDNVERIEIVRGPMSALYGSEAIAGVINIISRHHQDSPFVELNAEGGNFGTGTFGSETAGQFRFMDYSFGGSYERVGEQIGLDSLYLGTVGLNTAFDLGGKKFLQFNVRYDNRETSGYPEGSGGPEFALQHIAENDHAGELVTGATYQQQWKPWWTYNIDFDAFRRTDHNYTPAIWDQIPPTFYSLPSTLGDTDFRRLRFQEGNNFRISSALMSHLGIGWVQEHGSNNSLISGSDPFDFDLDRNTLDVSGELIYSARRLTASAGLGINKTEGYNANFSPRVGANYLLWSNTHLKGTWSKGFFIPSFYALSEPVIGNPNLKPEHSNSFDVGIDHDFLRPHLQLSTTYFHNSMTDLVDFDATIFELVNRDHVLTQGIEFGSKYDIKSNLQFGANVSWLEWSLLGTSEPLRYVPHWQGGANLDWKANRRLHAGVEALVVGRRYDYQIPVPYILTVGGYMTANLMVNYEIRDNLSVHLRAENLLNSNYHEYIGFPNPGIYVRAGVTYRFKPVRP